MAALGDILYRASSLWTRLAGNTTSTKKFLTQTGTGSVSAAPGWNTLVNGDLPDTAVTPATYGDSTHVGQFTVNQKGVITAASNVAVSGGGGGTVTTTGSPANGNLTKFSGATSITNGDLSGDVTTSGTLATTIANNAVTTAKILNSNVTLAKIANAAANSVLVGSGASGSGSPYAEIALGTNLSMSGTTLNASGSGSSFFTDVVAASDQDISSNTVVQNDNELFFTMVANKAYYFEGYIAYSSPSGGGTPDFKYTFNGPATLTGQFVGLTVLSITDTQGNYGSSAIASTPLTLGTEQR